MVDESLDAKTLERKLKVRARAAEWRRKNKDRVREWHRTSREIKPEKYMLHQTRHRAKVHGIHFALSERDIVIPKRCPLLGIELHKGTGAGKHQPCSPSLDRIDPAFGYIPGNVWVISNRANTIKNNATWQELAAIAEGMRKLTQDRWRNGT